MKKISLLCASIFTIGFLLILFSTFIMTPPSVNQIEEGILSQSWGEHSTLPLMDGKVLIHGKMDSLIHSRDGLYDIEIFDPVANTSVYKKVKIAPTLIGITFNALEDGNILIMGGKIGSNSYPLSIYTLNSETLLLEPVGQTKAPRCFHSAVNLKNNTFLIFGGYSNSTEFQELRSAEIFNLKNKTSQIIASLQFPRKNASTYTLKKGKVIIWGGERSQKPSVEVFDPIQKTFSIQMNGSVVSQASFQGQPSDNEIIDYVMHADDVSPVCILDCERHLAKLIVTVYNYKTQKLEYIESPQGLDFDISSNAVVKANGDVIFSALENHGPASVSNRLMSFNVFTGKIKNRAQLKHKRSYHHLTLLKNGQVLVTGGMLDEEHPGFKQNSKVYSSSSYEILSIE